jgi:hypothetical protein
LSGNSPAHRLAADEERVTRGWHGLPDGFNCGPIARFENRSSVGQSPLLFRVREIEGHDVYAERCDRLRERCHEGAVLAGAGTVREDYCSTTSLERSLRPISFVDEAGNGLAAINRNRELIRSFQ